ncbi:tigger transposable element-derived protein 6-like [Acyrthosiphon pisum]|uniref:HTH CENPB-type domain-containing protein n=1 Tax=Acyrthosiphon pisum TaxID=7029 RepID=A0A8R2A864_ACYPI|nr:tigger transposable element-derived protein 6-like [Acyrthosiphon pisum]|eukprot:XP_003248468.1 PREDICTED: tigger transposable element-derived protein 6-like [Acyrthosiphon pisum]
MTTLKRKRLSLREKIDILDYRKNNGNVGIRVLAEKFQVGKTQIADIVSNTEEIYKAKTREKNLPVSGPTIQEKAKQLAEVHGLNDFKASNGWLEKFRKRHNISFKSICGEASSVDRIAVDDWKKKLPNIIDKYEKRDIFNADETELFFRVLPNKTMAFKNETCNGGKVSKERLTVLLCCNIIGEFERPLIIGKAKRPRAFKKLDVNKFPVDWCWNKKAWMTTQIMTDWLMKFR